MYVDLFVIVTNVTFSKFSLSRIIKVFLLVLKFCYTQWRDVKNMQRTKQSRSRLRAPPNVANTTLNTPSRTQLTLNMFKKPNLNQFFDATNFTLNIY